MNVANTSEFEIVLQGLRDKEANEILSKLDDFAFESSSDFEIFFITNMRVLRTTHGKLRGVTKRQLTILKGISRRR